MLDLPANMNNQRPLSPEALKHFLEKRAARYLEVRIGENVDPEVKISRAQTGLLAGMLTECLNGENGDRYLVNEWLTGVRSTNDIYPEMVLAMLDWIKPEKSSSGIWIPSRFAIQEAQNVLRICLEESGQKSFLDSKACPVCTETNIELGHVPSKYFPGRCIIHDDMNGEL